MPWNWQIGPEPVRNSHCSQWQHPKAQQLSASHWGSTATSPQQRSEASFWPKAML